MLDNPVGLGDLAQRGTAVFSRFSAARIIVLKDLRASIARTHADHWLSLISPRYNTCPPAAWRLIDIAMDKDKDTAKFIYSLNRDKLRTLRRRERRYTPTH